MMMMMTKLFYIFELLFFIFFSRPCIHCVTDLRRRNYFSHAAQIWQIIEETLNSTRANAQKGHSSFNLAAAVAFEPVWEGRKYTLAAAATANAKRPLNNTPH
jgi:hypothetical protein